MTGVRQATKGAPSRLHSKLAPTTVEVKAKVAEVEVTVPLGPAMMAVSSGAPSTVKGTPVEGGEALPAGSVAMAVTVCAPGGSALGAAQEKAPVASATAVHAG